MSPPHVCLPSKQQQQLTRMHTIRKSKLQQMLKLNLRNPCDKFCHSLVMSHILNISITLIPSHFAAEQGAVFSLICNLPPSEPPIPIPCVALPQLENQASSPKVEYSPDDWCHFQVSYRSPTPPPSLTPSHQIRLVSPHHVEMNVPLIIFFCKCWATFMCTRFWYIVSSVLK